MTNDSSFIVNLISICIGVLGFILAFFMYLKDKNNKDIKKLEEQIRAFYIEEDVAAEELSKLNGKSKKTIKTELRNMAQHHPENFDNLRPETPSSK